MAWSGGDKTQWRNMLKTDYFSLQLTDCIDDYNVWSRPPFVDGEQNTNILQEI